MSIPTPTGARNLLDSAEFEMGWPQDVQRIVHKAANTDGEIPSFAHKEVKWALGTARRTEQSMLRDIEQGEKLLPHNRKAVR